MQTKAFHLTTPLLQLAGDGGLPAADIPRSTVIGIPFPILSVGFVALMCFAAFGILLLMKRRREKVDCSA